MARQKTSVRLDPEVISLGRRLAKKDFGSEQKFGLLIENAIRAYHARQVQPVEASSLLSATEQALIDRIEKRIENMGKQTVERVGNLIAKSSFETAYSSIILEQLFSANSRQAKSQLESIRSQTVQRMRNRLDKESAEEISSLLAENQNLEQEIQSLKSKLDEANTQAEKYYNHAVNYKNQGEDLGSKLRTENEHKADIIDWTKGLLNYLEEHSAGIMKKSASRLVEEYASQHRKPRGI